MSRTPEFADILGIQLAAIARSRWTDGSAKTDVMHGAMAQMRVDLAVAFGLPFDINSDDLHFASVTDIPTDITPEQAAQKTFDLLGKDMSLSLQAGDLLEQYAAATTQHIDLLTKRLAEAVEDSGKG